MRAQFIYEAFKEQSDPIKDMNIGDPFVKRFNEEYITYYLEVTEPNGHVVIYEDNTKIYKVFMGDIEGYKSERYKFRRAKVVTRTKVESVEEL